MMRRIITMITRRKCEADPIATELARDFGAPADVVSRVLDQTAAELRELAAIDEAADARPIINKAIDELARYGYQSRPHEQALMERCLEELPELDLTILCHFKQGRKHRQIAEIMQTDVESVRRSLVKTYADLRMKMRAHEGADPTSQRRSA